MDELRTRDSRSRAAKTLGAFLVLVAALLPAAPAWAENMTVETTNDEVTANDKCSLREAIENANNNAQTHADCPAGESAVTDVIGFEPGLTGDISLGGAQLQITDGVTINGPGANVLSVSGDDSLRVFDVSGGTNEINGLTITEGSSTSGGGIMNSATLTLDEVALTDNTVTGDGGGISNSGTLTLSNSLVSDNTAGSGLSGDGGGILSQTDSNLAAPSTKTTIVNSTISGNGADNAGGGVHNTVGLTEIKNSTITNNTASNFAGSGVRSAGNENTRTTVFSSIIAGNTNPPSTISDIDFHSNTNPYVSGGFNLIGTSGTGARPAFNQSTDYAGATDPGLEPLQNNGGPTMTHEVEEDSGAIDGGDSGTLTNDQRGEDRTSDFPDITNAKDGTGDGTDIGAYERKYLNPLGCTVFGTPDDNVLDGTPGRDVICGFGGNDTIKGLGGNDDIYGGLGDDTVSGGAGKDTIIGDGGSDRLFGQGGKDFLDVRDGVRRNDLADGGAGRDRCASDPKDTIKSCP